jgi:hypothetical protein
LHIPKLGMGVLSALLLAFAFVLSAHSARADGPDGSPASASTGNAPPKDAPLSADESVQPDLRPHQAALGAQAFWVVGKVMPSVVLRFDLHKLLWLDVEAGLIFLTNSPPRSDAFVGSPFGAHVLVAPFRTPKVELAAGLGVDTHYLWGINGDLVEVAMSVIASAHYWITPKFGLFGSARGYPIATSGLELGNFRDGRAGLPVLFATGVALSYP